MPAKKFWMLSADGGNGSGPSRRYEDRAVAVTEGERLARKENNRVYLMESVDAVLPVPAAVAWTHIPDPALATEQAGKDDWADKP